MKKVAVIASVLAGLGSVALGYLYIQRLEAEVSGGPKIGVLVASQDVPLGAALEEKLVAVREIPQAYLEERHVRADELNKVLKSRVTGGLRANEAILWSDLAEFSDKSRVLSGLIKQGMRAVTLNGGEVDFGGLLRPGDRVDVLLSLGDGKADSSTRTLLQNLLVLSVGSNISRAGDTNGRIRSGGMVTLSTTVEAAQILAEARKRGQLSLSLRNDDDITILDGLPETTAASLEVDDVDTSSSTQTQRGASRARIDRVR